MGDPQEVKNKGDCSLWSELEHEMLLRLLVDAEVDIMILVLSSCKFTFYRICIHIIYNILEKKYLVDCEFANRRNFLAPFRSTQYHLQEFRGQEQDPKNQKPK